MANLYVVRHGNTFEAGEAPRRVGARTDLPLTAAGLAQAEALGRHFADAGIRFTAVLSGPLLRTRQTAAAIIAFSAAPACRARATWYLRIEARENPGIEIRRVAPFGDPP